MERTAAIIKPNAVKDGHTGPIINLIELNGFAITAMRKMTFSTAQAQAFYAIHKERPFFGELVDSMCAGPVVVMELTKEKAIQEWRDLMGATNPANAAPGTMRRMFGTSIGSNATHGSDAAETAAVELKLLFDK